MSVDSFTDYIAQRVRDDPDFARHLESARARMDRATFRPCPWGTCEISVDPLNNEIIGAVGIIMCGCDSLPGWRSKFYDGLPKPGWSVKPVGRHGGRIAASRRKHADHARWQAESDV